MKVAETPKETARLLKLATYASTATASTLILAKLIAWLWTDAVSILATLMDSCLDALASLINLIAVRFAIQPADREHRFGHGKAEALAGLGQATFIAGSAMFLLLESTSRLLHPHPLTIIGPGILVMAFSILVTCLLLLFQRHVIHKTGSNAIKADALHYRTDLLINATVMVALFLSSQGWPGFDPIFAIGITFYILYSAWGIAHESVHLLLDRELPKLEREKIKTTVLSHPQVRGLHDLRTRKSGTTIFIQLHLELDDEIPLIQAHTISDEVEAAIKRVFPGAEVIIHEDPASLMEPKPDFAHD